MSKDIRSFFTPAGSAKKNTESKHSLDKATKTRKKRVVIISDSDDDDELIPPVKKTKSNSGSIQSSESKNRVSEDVTPPEPKIVRAIDIFGCDRVKRSTERTAKDRVVEVVPQTKPVSHKKKDNSKFDDEDIDFEATLMQLDAIEAEAVNTFANTNKKDKKPKVRANETKEPSVITIETKVERSNVPRTDPAESASISAAFNPAKSAVDKETKKSKNKKTAPVKSENEDDEPSWVNDPAEKKRLSAIGYQHYLQREGPKHLGSKEIPKGKPNCLKGLVFVVTGVLDSIERDAAAALIQEFGGKVTSTVSKNTSYIVLGEDPGPSKVHKAKQCGTKQIDEDGLFDIIRTNSGEAPVKKNASPNKKHDAISTNPRQEKHLGKNDKTVKEDNKSISPLSKTEKINNVYSFKTPKLISTSKSCDQEDASRAGCSVSTTPQAAVTAIKTPPSLLWVDKYRPTSTKQIIGQQGDNSNVKKLMDWLQNWHRNQFSGKRPPKPSPWARNDNGGYFKAALLSGPPGVGKTTTAHLVCKELGYDIVEFNASDTRSKKLLREEVSELLSSKSLYEFFKGGGKEGTSTKHVLLMDEVDGMAGTEDRGGIGELIDLIKNSKVPVVCMCNDRNHQKMRSFVDHCFDLRFSKPRVEQIKGAMMSVCFKEGVKLSPDVLTNMIIASCQDVRQVLHHLSLHSTTVSSVSTESSKTDPVKPLKNIKLGPWDVLNKVFSAEDHKSMSINDKSDLFFHDYSLAPLFVQENYLSVAPDEATNNIYKRLDLIAAASDSICWGDVVDKTIRSKMSWGLLPVQGMYASVIPGTLLEGKLTAQIRFPSWLGKNSRRSKFDRLLQELYIHSRLSTSGSKQSFNEDYLPRLRHHISQPLVAKGEDGIAESMEVMKSYHLIRSDIDSIMELGVWPKEKNPLSLLETKMKTAFTKAVNKGCSMLPYSTVSTSTKKQTGNAGGMQEGEFEEEDGIEEEDEDDVKVDAMVKEKKRLVTKKEPTAGSSTAKRSRGSASDSSHTKKRTVGKGKGKAK